MTSLKLKEATKLEAINELLQARLPGRFGGEISNNRLRLVASSAKGCIISLRSTNGDTNCSIVGFMPSILLRALLLAGITVALSLATSLVLGEFNVLIGGAIPFAIAFFSMSLPSRGLVADISAVVRDELAVSPQSRLQTSRWRAIAGVGICVVLAIALAVLSWPDADLATKSAPEKRNVNGPSASDRQPPQPANEVLVNQYSVVALVSGTISHLHPGLRPGEIISRKTILVRIGVEDLGHSLQSTETELGLLRSALELIAAEESVLQGYYESKREQLTEEIDEHLLNIGRQEVERLKRELEGISARRQLAELEIAAAERKLAELERKIERAQISLPVDVRIDAVMVSQNDFVSVNSLLFEATEIKTEPR